MVSKSVSQTFKLIAAVFFLAASFLLTGCTPEKVTTSSVPPKPSPSTPSPSPTFTPTPTTQPIIFTQSSSQPAPTAEESTPLPPSALITGISGHEQTYELGCEASAAVDWAGYYDVLIYESTFQFELPVSDNPDLGFVGNVTTDGWGQIPPDAYGVHAQPVADLLREYGLPAKAVRGMTLAEVKAELSEGNPIIAWVIGNMVYSSPVKVYDKQGNAVIVAPYEHVVILTGYNETDITYMNNGNFFSVPVDVFLTSWGVLGNMAVIND